MKKLTAMTVSKLLGPIVNDFPDDELEVANILLGLCSSFLRPQYQSSFQWRRKRKRSALENSEATSTSQPPPLPPPTTTRTATVKRDACSPSSPLAFPSSEPDCNPKSPKMRRTASKGRENSEERDRLGRIVDELTQERVGLRKAINDISIRGQQLKDENYNIKQALICNIESVRRGPGLGQLFTQTQPTVNDYRLLSAHTQCVFYRAAGLVINGPAGIEQHYYPGSLGPLGIPDLNVSGEESCRGETMKTMSYWRGGDGVRKPTKAEAAAARRERCRVIKEKSRGVNGLRKPTKAEAAAARRKRCRLIKEKSSRMRLSLSLR